MTGERQTQKFREKYVNAILSQEIGWFDNCGANELSTRVAELMEKVHYLSFFSNIIIGLQYFYIRLMMV